MTTNHLQKINQYGQSIWMDNLSRDIIQLGKLKDLVKNQGNSGITSKPVIFEKAIAGDKTQGINAGNIIYHADIEAGVRASLPTSKIYESLVFADIGNACDSLRPKPHLQRRVEGIDKFIQPFQSLMNSLEEKIKVLSPV